MSDAHLITSMKHQTYLFYSKGECVLTITEDGVLIPGKRLSPDEATQRAAKSLAKNFSKLHRDQAEELRVVKAERDEARAEAQRQYDENVNRIAAEGAALLRAEAAEARLEEQDASWRETLRIERDARLKENRLKMKATARLEEAKAVLEPFAKAASHGDGTGDFEIPDGHPVMGTMTHDGYQILISNGDLRRARAFLHQGGEE